MLSKDNVYKRIQQARTILQKQVNNYFSGINKILESENQENFPTKYFPFEKSELSNFLVADRQ